MSSAASVLMADNKIMDYYNYLFVELAGKRFSMRSDCHDQILNCFADARTNDWPLIKSPLPGLTILILYLYFVNSWGPRYMANRKPFKLETVLIVYNFIQVLVSCYIFYEVRACEQTNFVFVE